MYFTLAASLSSDEPCFTCPWSQVTGGCCTGSTDLELRSVAEVGEAWGFPEGREPTGMGGVSRDDHRKALQKEEQAGQCPLQV